MRYLRIVLSNPMDCLDYFIIIALITHISETSYLFNAANLARSGSFNMWKVSDACELFLFSRDSQFFSAFNFNWDGMSAKMRERQKSLAKIPQILRNVLSHKQNQYYREETYSLFELTVLAVEKMWFRTSRRTVTEWRGSPSKCVVGSIVSEAALYVVQMGEKEKK